MALDSTTNANELTTEQVLKILVKPLTADVHIPEDGAEEGHPDRAHGFDQGQWEPMPNERRS